MDVKVVIDGAEVALVPDGETKQFERFKEPGGFPAGEDGKSPLLVKVYVRKGWKP